MSASVKSSMKFSLWPSPERSWEEVRDLAEYGDRQGWHCLWYADHFMPNSEVGEVLDGNVYECWSVIAAVAAVTKTLRIGSLVSPTTVRHPAVLANTAATIDRISGGRLVLGIGAGWQVNEHNAYGIDLLSGKDRVDRFEEAIQIIKSLLNEPRTSFAGKHFSITDAPCQPTTVQNPLPLMVGTGGPRMQKISARHADEWNTWGHVETASRVIDTFRTASDSVGRDPDTVHKSVQAMFFLAEDEKTIEKIRLAAPADRTIVGSDAHIIEQLNLFKELGYNEIIIPDFTLGRDPVSRLNAYERFRTDILPFVD